MTINIWNQLTVTSKWPVFMAEMLISKKPALVSNMTESVFSKVIFLKKLLYLFLVNSMYLALTNWPVPLVVEVASRMAVRALLLRVSETIFQIKEELTLLKETMHLAPWMRMILLTTVLKQVLAFLVDLKLPTAKLKRWEARRAKRSAKSVWEMETSKRCSVKILTSSLKTLSGMSIHSIKWATSLSKLIRVRTTKLSSRPWKRFIFQELKTRTRQVLNHKVLPFNSPVVVNKTARVWIKFRNRRNTSLVNTCYNSKMTQSPSDVDNNGTF